MIGYENILDCFGIVAGHCVCREAGLVDHFGDSQIFDHYSIVVLVEGNFEIAVDNRFDKFADILGLDYFDRGYLAEADSFSVVVVEDPYRVVELSVVSQRQLFALLDLVSGFVFLICILLYEILHTDYSADLRVAVHGIFYNHDNYALEYYIENRCK